MLLKNKVYLTFLILLISSTIHAQQFDLFKNKEISYQTSITDLEIGYQKVLKKKDTSEIVTKLIALSEYHRSKLNYGTAFNYSGDALFLAEQIKDTLLLAKAHREQGILSYLFKQDTPAGFNFKQANRYLKKLAKTNKNINAALLNSYYNLVLYYQRIEHKEYLTKYVDTCRVLANDQKLNSKYELYLQEKIACTYIWSHQYPKAITLLNSSISELEQQKDKTDFLIILYADLGKVYSRQQKYTLAKMYFKKSIDVVDTTGEYLFFKAYVYQRYGQLLFKNQEYKEAFLYLNKSKKINDTYLNPRNEQTQGFLTLKNRYQEQLHQSNVKINRQKLKIAAIEQNILQFKFLLIIGISILLLTGTLIWIRNRNKKHEKEQKESSKKIEENNKELTVHTLRLIEKEEIIHQLKDELLKKSGETSTKNLIKSIDKQSLNLWEDFNQRFIVLNKGFYDRLQKKVPNLSASELKLCALIKLNFSGKEMAYLLGISLGSVHVARHRLRKKINLDRQTNLTSFINNI
ncbi:helix-turn-helix transcriptional regulator [Ochrovirga pacifica]|uniref:helix-turn-helix transcriptional regulator n=1 Tax=Ochrovirga pacifica TaxID=1042376 RepID=UPI000255A04C|nr:LuxR family transcriptional regulator [Ochrovirga pacifica]